MADTEDENYSDDPAKIIQAAKDCLEDYQQREYDNIHRAEEAIKFRALEQWPDAIKKDRENPNQDGGTRACPVLDKTNQYIRQIVNEERQNRAAIKIRPVDDIADPDTAEIFTGIIRHIEDQSEATMVYTSAGEQAVDGGFGYFRVLAEYSDPLSFDQDIKIRRIHNRFSVAMGPHTQGDGADVKEVVIWEDIPRKDFKIEYPDAEEVGFDNSDSWSDSDAIRIAEYFCIIPETITIHQFQDGSTMTDKDYQAVSKQAIAQGIPVPPPVKSRDSTIKKVKWYKLSSKEILDEKELPGQYIPVIKVIGNEIVMPDGSIRLSGALEAMMDPQRLHNYAHAGFIEHVALAPRAPWVAAIDATKGLESDYARANRDSITLLSYNHLDDAGNPLPAPQRTPPAGIAPGWQQMLQNTEHGIEASAGMYGPTVGARSQEKSGIALQEQKSQGAVGNYHYPDNLARSIQQCGRILLEWIPVYFDTARIVRMLGEGGEHKMVSLNPDQQNAVQPNMDEFNREIGKIYNLNVGKYDVSVSTGPSYSSKRMEAAANFMQLLSGAPGLMNVIGDLAFKYSDFPGADALAERMKVTLLPEIKQMEMSKEQGQDPKVQAMMMQVQQAAQQIQAQGQQLAQHEQQLNQVAQQVGADKQAVDSARKELEAAKKVFQAEVKEQSANLRLQAMEMQQNDSAEPEMLAEKEIIIAKMKEEHADARFYREMALKEYQAGLVSKPNAEVLAEMINNLAINVQGLNDSARKSKTIRIQRDANGDIVNINDMMAQRDAQGNLIGLQAADMGNVL
jgi:hypothetical protein